MGYEETGSIPVSEFVLAAPHHPNPSSEEEGFIAKFPVLHGVDCDNRSA
jgi:hypothetical protein